MTYLTESLFRSAQTQVIALGYKLTVDTYGQFVIVIKLGDTFHTYSLDEAITFATQHAANRNSYVA